MPWRKEFHMISKKYTITAIVTAIVFFMYSLMLSIPNGYSVGPVFLLLLSPSVFFIKKENTLKSINKFDVILILSFVVYFIVLLSEVLWFNLKFREIDKPVRFLFSVPIFFLLLKYPPSLSWLWRGIIIGAVSAGILSIYQKLWLHHDRANGFIYPIQFGDLSMLLGVLCLTGIAWGRDQIQYRLWIIAFSSGAALGVCASLLSGSRGGWIGLPIIIFILIKNYVKFLSWRQWIGVIVAGAILFLSIVAIPETGVLVRIHHIYIDIYKYYHGDSFTSLGARFDLWRMANYMFGHRPIFGYGSYEFIEMRDMIVSKFGYGQTVIEQDLQSAHNEILDAAAKRGSIGVLALLCIYLIPLSLFSKYRYSKDMTTRSLALAGSMVPICFIDFGMSQVLFTHNDAVMFYPYTVCIFWACLRERQYSLKKNIYL